MRGWSWPVAPGAYDRRWNGADHMVDETRYRELLRAAEHRACPFARALLARCVGCSRSRWLYLADRQAVVCDDESLRSHCVAFYDALHENARFALRIDPDAPWPFAKEMRAQCGGARGLSAALNLPDDESADIGAAVAAGVHRFGAPQRFPYSEIMRRVAQYRLRSRSR